MKSQFIHIADRWFNVASINELHLTPAGTVESGRTLEADRLRIWFGPEDCSTLYGAEAAAFLAALAESEKAAQP